MSSSKAHDRGKPRVLLAISSMTRLETPKGRHVTVLMRFWWLLVLIISVVDSMSRTVTTQEGCFGEAEPLIRAAEYFQQQLDIQ